LKHNIFAVFDSKTGIYSQPFLLVNRETAIRAFGFAARSSDNEIGRYPHDHKLYALGLFDDSNGTYESIPPEYVCGAHELLSEE